MEEEGRLEIEEEGGKKEGRRGERMAFWSAGRKYYSSRLGKDEEKSIEPKSIRQE